MKNYLFIILFIFGFSSSVIAGPQSLITVISKGIESSDATLFSVYLNDFIDVTLEEKTQTYSRKQATLVIDSYLKKLKVTSFRLKSSGNSGNNYCYIAEINTKNRVYIAYFFSKKAQNKESIIEIRIKKN